MKGIYIGYTTTETREDAERLAHGAVEERYAACAQIDGPIRSVYTWKNEVETASEYRIAFKYPIGRADALRQWILREHPYENPEWVTVAVADGSEEYATWVDEVCHK